MYPKVYEGKEPYIFVSYAHKDSQRVLPIVRALQEQGFRVWYDAGIEAGTEWPEYIAEHLVNSQTFLAFISKASLDSHNCYREINFAIDQRKPHLVIYLEDVKLSVGMQMQLGVMQAMFRTRHSSEASFLEELCSSRVLQACKGTATGAKERGPALSPKEAFSKGIDCLGTEENEEGVKWVRMAAEQGLDLAQNFLGELYEAGYGGLEEDPAEAVRWYRKAAEQGLDDAQFRLGFCYINGIGVAENPAEASLWIYKAAHQGHADAQYYLGYFYLQGIGVPKNEKEAVEWFRKAARQDNEPAQETLAHYGIKW